MRTFVFDKLVGFYPYESVHASDVFLKMEATGEFFSTIRSLLIKYEPEAYYNSKEGDYDLSLDNKITLQFEDEKDGRVFCTIWDTTVYFGFSVKPINKPFAAGCSVKLKQKAK